jgi:hypothetical protein
MLEWLRGRPIEVPLVAAGSIVMFLLIVARTQGLTREVTLQDERRRLLGRVLQAAEDERTRIAHDLHDGPVQQLAVLNYDVYRARKRIGELLGRVAGDALMQELQGTDEVLEGSRRGSARRPGCCARSWAPCGRRCSTTAASPRPWASTPSGSSRSAGSPSTSGSASPTAAPPSWRPSRTGSPRSR